MSAEAQLDKTGKPLPMQTCWVCGYQFDAATSLYGECRPRPGDLTLCLKCGELYVFTDRMGIRIPTLAEMSILDNQIHREIERVQRVIRRERVKG